MITRLFDVFGSYRLDAEDPSERLRALERLDPAAEGGADALRRLAAEDPDAGVRQAAVSRMEDPGALLGLMDDATAAEPARRRLATLIDGGLDALALAEASNNPATDRHLLDAAREPRHWQALLARIDDEDVLADVAGHHDLPAVRLAAARRVISEPLLRRVEKAARQRDKDVLQHVREALEQRRALRQRLDDAATALASMAGEIEALVRGEDENQLQQRHDWLRERVESEATAIEEALTRGAGLALELAGPDAELARARSGLERLGAQVRTRLEARQAEEAEARRREEDRARARALLDGVEAAAARVAERLARDEAPQTVANRARSDLEQAAREWSALEASVPVEERRAVDAACARLGALLGATERLQRLLDADVGGRELDGLDWPDDLPEPAALGGLRDRIEARQREGEQVREQTRTLRARIDSALRELDAALKAGHLARATQCAARARKAAGRLAGGPDERLRQRLDRASAQIDELADWQRFATDPKRRALCEEMEGLARSVAEATDPVPDPEALADRIRALREAWNALGPARDDDARALVKRFDDAAQQAFEPCQRFFEARHEQRRYNLDNRRKICVELESFEQDYDWQAPDWKAVDRIVREAGRQWRRFADVETGPGRKVGKRYHEVSTRLRDRLEARREENRASRQALVDRARQLAAGAEADGTAIAADAAADEAKRLQRAWQQVDIMQRNVERRQWKAFRSACDRIFARLGNERDSAREAVLGTLDELERRLDVCRRALEQAAATPLREVDAGEADATELAAIGRGLDELDPAAVPGPQRRRLGQLERTLRDLRETQRGLQRRARRRDALAGLVAALAGDAPDQAPQPVAPDADAATAARTACIDLEIGAGLEGPEAEQPMRMQRQVERLAAGMRGQRAADDLETLADAVARLLGAQQADPAATAPFIDRARAGLDRLLDG